jgi:16S rRNA G1207 methylase RsmC
MGCGYGPIGLMLKSLYRDSVVHMVDRDALAVAYSRQNAELNKLEGVNCYGSLGYDDVSSQDFDLIVSNIPGKAGLPVITCLLREAGWFLSTNGLAAVVVVSPLDEVVAGILEDTPGIEIIHKRSRAGYAVFHYRFTGETHAPVMKESALERDVYHRKDVTMRLTDLEYTVATAYSLPEFDTLSYATGLLARALHNIMDSNIIHAAVLNPGQGHIPVMLWKIAKPDNLFLVDRDLLALRISRLNLMNNKCPADQINLLHQVGIDIGDKEKVDLFIGVLREEEKQNVTFQALDTMIRKLNPGGMIILAASSTPITRVVSYVESQGLVRIKGRERWKGHSLLVLTHV